MGFSVAPSPVYFSSKIRFLCHHKFKFSSNPILIRPPKNPRIFSLPASIAQKDLQLSWFASDQNGTDEFNGWAVFEPPVKMGKKEKVSTLAMVGAVASVALIGVIAYISLSKKGFPLHFRSQINAIQRVLEPSKTEEGFGSESVDPDVWMENAEVSEGSNKPVSNPVEENIENESQRHISARGQLQRILIPIAVDSTQQEALSALKELKIIEDDVKADELCTRREYARWLVLANSLLERNRKHRIVPSAVLSGSKVPSFNDVNIEDPDFEHIQSLAEVGIIPSNLSGGHLDEDREGLSFSPESFISREDLVSWKAKLEYGVLPWIDEEISRRNIGVLDAREISSDAIIYLFMDLQEDEKSILRRTFGQSNRFQPRKPSTKAQAVVALTSGRMEDFISIELSRIKAENASKKIAMQEIRSELLEKGDIKKFWDKKMEEERVRGQKVEKAYLTAISDLEKEKTVKENIADEFLKQKVALDCQKQLLYNLKEEVNEMSERLPVEKAKYIDERSNIDTLLSDMLLKYEGLLDAKSILEAEIEALRILRSWVEDEARKSHARAKVLEEVERRWKWYKQS